MDSQDSHRMDAPIGIQKANWNLWWFLKSWKIQLQNVWIMWQIQFQGNRHCARILLGETSWSLRIDGWTEIRFPFFFDAAALALSSWRSQAVSLRLVRWPWLHGWRPGIGIALPHDPIRAQKMIPLDPHCTWSGSRNCFAFRKLTIPNIARNGLWIHP